LREDLGQLPDVTTHDLGTHRCAIVTAKVAGRSADGVAVALGRATINVSTTVAEHNPLDTEERGIHPLVRFSPHYYNTEAEIDRTVAAVAEFARAGGARKRIPCEPAEVLAPAGGSQVRSISSCTLCAPTATRTRTYCLGGTFEARPGSAGCRLTCRLTVPIMADRGLTQPEICGRWLPVWLPGISLATLMSG